MGKNMAAPSLFIHIPKHVFSSVLTPAIVWQSVEIGVWPGAQHAISISVHQVHSIRFILCLMLLISPPGWAEVAGCSVVSQLKAAAGCQLDPVVLLKSWPLTHLENKGFAYKWWSDSSVIWPVSQCHSMPLLDNPFIWAGRHPFSWWFFWISLKNVTE